MKTLEFCKAFNDRMIELGLPQRMEIKEELQSKAVFSIVKNVAGFFWLDDGEITGVTITMAIGGDHTVTLLLLASIVDILTGIGQEDRNFVFACLGLKNGTYTKGKSKRYKDFQYKIYKTKDLLMLDVYRIKRAG